MTKGEGEGWPLSERLTGHHRDHRLTDPTSVDSPVPVHLLSVVLLPVSTTGRVGVRDDQGVSSYTRSLQTNEQIVGQTKVN